MDEMVGEISCAGIYDGFWFYSESTGRLSGYEDDQLYDLGIFSSTRIW